MSKCDKSSQLVITMRVPDEWVSFIREMREKVKCVNSSDLIEEAIVYLARNKFKIMPPGCPRVNKRRKREDRIANNENTQCEE